MTQPNTTTPSIVSPSIIAETDLILLAKAAEHDSLWELTGGDDDPADGFMDQMCSLEIEIASTPVHTQAALAAKMRVIERAEFCPAIMEVVNSILKHDRARIG